MPFMIVPAARPDLALTLVTDNGAAALALLPRHPGSRMQLFDNVPCDLAAAEPEATPHALLAMAGARAGVPVEPVDADAQAHILDFAVALYRASTASKADTAFQILMRVVNHTSLADAIADVANTKWNMPLDGGAVRRLLALFKQPTPNKALAAFFKSANGNKATMEQIARASTDYAALAKVLAAHGVSIGAQDLQSYLAPWTYYTQMLQGLKARGAISEAKYEDAIGFNSAEFQISGVSPDIDPNLVAGWLSAMSATAKLPAFDDFTLPMEALMIPFTAAVSDTLSGQNSLQLKNIPGMMVDGVMQGFQSAADSMQSFGDDLRSL